MNAGVRDSRTQAPIRASLVLFRVTDSRRRPPKSKNGEMWNKTTYSGQRGTRRGQSRGQSRLVIKTEATDSISIEVPYRSKAELKCLTKVRQETVYRILSPNDPPVSTHYSKCETLCSLKYQNKQRV